MIRGGYHCVCFTEAPLAALADGFESLLSEARYAPFGLMLDKEWLYARGGRPVIYQPDSEFTMLPEEMRWRHVRYELTNDSPVDFSWEREWRIHCDELHFSSRKAIVVVPNLQWRSLIKEAHEYERNIEVELYATVLEREIAEQFRNPFSWRIVTLW